MMFKSILALSAIVGAVLAEPWVAAPRDAHWLQRHEALLKQTHDHGKDVQIAFLGDSITEGWKGAGHEVFAKHYGNRHVYNYGIGGDRTEHVLYRLKNKEFEGTNPKVVTLMIGTNNIGHDNSTAIAKGVSTILEELHTLLPHTKVLLISVLPRATVPADTQVHDINKIISRMADHKRVHWLDLSVFFETALAHEVAELYVPDHVHLTPKGYEMWANKMEPTLKAMLADDKKPDEHHHGPIVHHGFM